MQKNDIKKEEFKLVGIQVRTNNTNEMDPSTAKISPTVHKFFNDGQAEETQNLKDPGILYCVYTDYESDITGDYTYFIGQEVTSFDNQPKELSQITIPAQNYVKFTNEPGKMPDVLIDSWHKIWEMSDEDFGGQRAYLADFEVYDERAADPDNTVVDIFIGVKK